MNAANVMRPMSTGMLKQFSIALLCIAAVTGCSTVKGWFGADKKGAKPTEPAELTEYAPTISVNQLWSVKVGKGENRIGARQAPSIADGKVYAAAVEGGVRAFDLQTGAAVWHYESELLLSGGPGAGEGLVVVGSLEGDVIALDAATGAEKWKAKVGNEVIATPVIGQGSVFVHANDGSVTAFDVANGQRRWVWGRELPTLTVRGNDAPLLGPGFVFVGNDDGTLVALSIVDGRVLWEQTVAQSDGRTELDRMADVDGTPALDGTTLYVSSYKQQTLAVDGPSGRPVWTSNAGGPARTGVSGDKVVVADAVGKVSGLDKSSGTSMWTQNALARRNLTGVAIQGDYAVVGDYDGYLHWMRLDNGELAARTRLGGKSIRATPVVADGILVVQNIDGDVGAYRIAQ